MRIDKQSGTAVDPFGEQVADVYAVAGFHPSCFETFCT